MAPLATRKDLDATRADIAALRKETKVEFAAMREETKADIAALREETKVGIAALRGESKADIAELKEQMATKTDIANINTKIESAKLRFSILLLGVIGSLLTVAASIVFT